MSALSANRPAGRSGSWPTRSLKDRNELLHRSILYAAGIDPATNIGMHNLCWIRQRSTGEYEGAEDVVVLIKVGAWHYAFGCDARLIRRVAPSFRSVSAGEGMGDWEAIHAGDAADAIRSVVRSKFRVSVVEVSSGKGGAA